MRCAVPVACMMVGESAAVVVGDAVGEGDAAASASRPGLFRPSTTCGADRSKVVDGRAGTPGRVRSGGRVWSCEHRT